MRTVCVLLCCVWYISWFINILQGYFTGTGAIIRLPHCQWSNPEEYGQIHFNFLSKPNTTKQKPCAYYVRYILHCRVDSWYGLNQWETTLHCNVVSHWLIPYSSIMRMILHCDVSNYGSNGGIDLGFEIWIWKCRVRKCQCSWYWYHLIIWRCFR